MNPIKRAYCRIYQQVFHVAIPFLPYRHPKDLNNNEELSKLLFKNK